LADFFACSGASSGIGGTLRLPMVPMTDALMPGLEAAMREAGLL